MSIPQSPAAFRPEVPGLAYFIPEAPKAPPVEKAAPSALAALEQMFSYYD